MPKEYVYAGLTIQQAYERASQRLHLEMPDTEVVDFRVEEVKKLKYLFYKTVDK